MKRKCGRLRLGQTGNTVLNAAIHAITSNTNYTCPNAICMPGIFCIDCFSAQCRTNHNEYTVTLIGEHLMMHCIYHNAILRVVSINNYRHRAHVRLTAWTSWDLSNPTSVNEMVAWFKTTEKMNVSSRPSRH
jgi:hypothetical protein